MNVSEEVFLLLDRMDTHPEEFLSEETNLIDTMLARESDTRWGRIVRMLLEEDFRDHRDLLFTKEEQNRLVEKLQELFRARLRENILHELVSGDRLKSIQERDKRLGASVLKQPPLMGKKSL
jgi:hypothetical protein